VEMILRGRENALLNFAKDKIKQFLNLLEKKTPIKTERRLKKQGRRLTMIVVKK
jgi:translation initiation factor IF-3